MKDTIAALFKQCGLGEITEDIRPVSGGLMHKMYKVHATSGVYAVKCLNPEIMKRPGVLSNYEEAEKLERILEAAAIPVVPALSFNGDKMLREEGQYFYIFSWQEGSITDWNAITKEQCFRAGEILGQIHGIDAQNTEREETEESAIDFGSYLQTAVEKNSSIAPLLKDSLPLLTKALEKLNAARAALPAILAIDDPDMDPKNIMWHENKAYVIDLECLERGNPAASCINLALQWAGTVNGQYDRDNLRAFFTGYLQAYDNGFRSYEELYGIAYTWVEWLEYNIRRALGMEGTEEDAIRLGEEEVRNTIGRIRYLDAIAEDVCQVLRELPVSGMQDVSR